MEFEPKSTTEKIKITTVSATSTCHSLMSSPTRPLTDVETFLVFDMGKFSELLACFVRGPSTSLTKLANPSNSSRASTSLPGLFSLSVPSCAS